MFIDVVTPEPRANLVREVIEVIEEAIAGLDPLDRFFTVTVIKAENQTVFTADDPRSEGMASPIITVRCWQAGKFFSADKDTNEQRLRTLLEHLTNAFSNFEVAAWGSDMHGFAIALSP